jgi:hypothetical protein
MTPSTTKRQYPLYNHREYAQQKCILSYSVFYKIKVTMNLLFKTTRASPSFHLNHRNGRNFYKRMQYRSLFIHRQWSQMLWKQPWRCRVKSLILTKYAYQPFSIKIIAPFLTAARKRFLLLVVWLCLFIIVHCYPKLSLGWSSILVTQCKRYSGQPIHTLKKTICWSIKSLQN